MTATMILAFTVAIAASDGGETLQSGSIPRSLAAPARVAWIAQDESEPPVDCAIPQPYVWACQSLSPHPRGMVVVVDADEGVAAIPVGLAPTESMPVLGTWGRVVRIVAGPVSPEDLHDVKLSVWRPARPASRPQTLRFETEEEPGVTVIPLSDSAFWITGRVLDPDAYIRIDGPAVASVRLSTAGLQSGQAEVPLFANVSPPNALQGQVQDEQGRDVENAVVELWVPLRPGEERAAEHQAGRAFLRWAVSRSDAQGRFDFVRMASDSYEISATHDSAGRASSVVSSLAEPLLLRLRAPAVATGRILRHGLAVEAARVRFVPDVAAFSRSTDPGEHVAADTRSDGQGQFTLPLPPVRAGIVQVSVPDGPVVRVPLPAASGSRDVALGDILMPDTRTTILRLLDPRVCAFTAAGPIGQLGLMLVHAKPMSIGVFQLALPEPGTWVLDAECGGRGIGVEPSLLIVPAAGPDVTVDVRLEDSPR